MTRSTYVFPIFGFLNSCFGDNSFILYYTVLFHSPLFPKEVSFLCSSYTNVPSIVSVYRAQHTKVDAFCLMISFFLLDLIRGLIC